MAGAAPRIAGGTPLLLLLLLLLEVTVADATQAEHRLNAYDRHYMTKPKYKVGEWTPPAPPANEASGLAGSYVPIPELTDIGRAHEFTFQAADRSAFRSGSKVGSAGGRKLLQAEAARGSKVPHNW